MELAALNRITKKPYLRLHVICVAPCVSDVKFFHPELKSVWKEKKKKHLNMKLRFHITRNFNHIKQTESD